MKHPISVSTKPAAGQAADVDAALISHQFGSKLGLWYAVIDHLSDEIVRSTSAIIAKERLSGNDGKSLCLAMEYIVDLACDIPELAPFIIQEVSKDGYRFEYIYERLVKPAHQLLLPLFQAAIASKSIKNRDPEFLFFTFASSVTMTVAMRALIARFSKSAQSDADFRRAVKAETVHVLLSDI